jgi:hypothetical protein
MDIGGPAFARAWAAAEVSSYGDQPIRILGLEDLIAAKRSTGRPQDLLDVSRLEAALQRRK